MFGYSRIRDASISNGLSRTRYFRPRIRRHNRRRPWYSNPRRRPTLSERDRRFRDWLRELLRERSRINNGNNVDSDSDDEKPEEPEVPPVNLSTKLHVKDLDLLIAENTGKHHTDMYDCTDDRVDQPAQLVVRRGQPFAMTVKFDRPYDIKKNDITLTFTLACEEKSTVKETFKVTESRDTSYRPRRWGANVVRKDGSSLTLEVYSPPSTPVGEWEISVRTIVDVKDGKDLIWQYNHNDEMVILFNPWCKEDTVYMSDEIWLEEAVLRDNGAVYYGTYKRIGKGPWNYGQFEDGILDAALHLLRRGFDFKTSKLMGNAVRVARVLSAIVNSQDDNGVITGNWSDDYSGGVSPTKWVGSVKILKQYMKTSKPVKYGQCWVFSHVLTTVCRALGLPCRSLTNFCSAHNTEDRLSCDTYYVKNKETNEITKLPSGDSTWNFHVWNEVWMSRPDLGREFDGWQAIDATPQEESDGIYCCGPAPVKAIKEGQINIGQDTAFVFAEVNADEVDWMINLDTGKYDVMSRKHNTIGKNVSTRDPRKPGLERLDITDHYKYPDGSKEERAVVKKAEKMFRQDNLETEEEEEPPKKPVELTIKEQDDIFVGSPFDVEIVAVNDNDSPRSINLTITVQYMTYFGNITGKAAQKKLKDVKLAAGERQSFTLHIPVKDTLSRPKENFNFKIRAVAEVVETENIITATDDFRLRKPDLVTNGPSTGRVGESLSVEVSFTNPLDISLTNVEVDIEGNIKTANDNADIRVPLIKPRETWKTTLQMVPTKKPTSSKERTVNFGLESDQLRGCIGSYSITLK